MGLVVIVEIICILIFPTSLTLKSDCPLSYAISQFLKTSGWFCFNAHWKSRIKDKHLRVYDRQVQIIWIVSNYPETPVGCVISYSKWLTYKTKTHSEAECSGLPQFQDDLPAEGTEFCWKELGNPAHAVNLCLVLWKQGQCQSKQWALPRFIPCTLYI